MRGFPTLIDRVVVSWRCSCVDRDCACACVRTSRNVHTSMGMQLAGAGMQLAGASACNGTCPHVVAQYFQFVVI